MTATHQHNEPWHHEFHNPATQLARKTERKTPMSKTRRLEEQLQRWQNAFARLAETVRATPGSRYPAIRAIAEDSNGAALSMLTVAERFAHEARIDAVSRPDLHSAIERESAIRVSAAVAEAQRKHAKHEGELRAEHMAKLEAGIEKARQDGRNEALATVIEALELDDYAPRAKLLSKLAASGPQVALLMMSGRSSFDPENPTVADLSTKPLVDVFWSDLLTALRVRAEDQEAERDEAAAERIRAITHPAPSTTASDFHLAGEKLEDAA